MFEGHIKQAGLDEAEQSSVLRHMRWTDLVARLEATRELRSELDRTRPSNFAAFNAHLGNAHPGNAHPGDSQGEQDRAGIAEDGKRTVNHDVLSHGKLTRRRPIAVANDAAHGDRDDT